MPNRIKIIHLSDFHINEDFDYNEVEIGFQNIISNSISPEDIVLTLFTGDLTYDGSKNYYSIFEKYIESLYSLISSKSKKNYFFLVPGNHDCDFKNKDGDIFQNCDNCFKRINRISRGISSSTPSIINMSYVFNDKKFLITMLNTAAFCSKNFDDYGKLKLDIKEISDHINNIPLSDYKILICHHQSDSFEPSSKMLLDRLFECYDLVFDGHEHNPKAAEITKGGISYLQFHGGEFWNIDSRFQNSTFGIYDMFDENIVQKVYKKSLEGYSRFSMKKHAIKKSGKNTLLCRNADFENDFFVDDLNIFSNIADGFEDFDLCKYCDANLEERFSFSFKDSIRTLIEDNKYVAIFGKDFTSKTISLKYIFKELSNEYVPVFLKRENFFGCKTIKDIDGAIKKQIVEQYSYKKNELDSLDKSKFLILLDDYDKLSSQTRFMVSDYVKNNFKSAVFTCTYDPFEQKRIADSESNGFTNYLIEDMNHRTMLKLIKSSISRLCENACDDSNFEEMVNTSLNVLDNNLSSYKHIPFFVRNISKFVFFNSSGQNTSGTNFSAIFDINIKKIISDRFPDKKYDFTDTVITCLSEIAYLQYQQNSAYFSETFINENIHNVFEQKDLTDIEEDEIKGIILGTHIIVKKGEQYCFENRITFAYFVANKVVELSGYDPKGEFSYSEFTKNARDKIFVSINSEVLLFLIYRKNDINLIKEIIKDSEQFFDPKKDYNCLTHKYKIIGTNQSDSIEELANEYEKLNAKKLKKKVKDLDEQNGIFDALDYSDVDKSYYTCLNYLRTLGTAFSGLSEKLDKDIKDNLVNKLFSYPNIFLNVFLEIVDNAIDFEQKQLKSGNLDTPVIFSKSVNLIRAMKRTLIVYSYDYVAKFSTNPKTISKLLKYKRSDNYIDYQKLMFAFYAGSSVFIARLREFATKYNDPMCINLANIAFYRFVERTGKYELGYDTDLLDKLKIKKNKPKLLSTEVIKKNKKK